MHGDDNGGVDAAEFRRRRRDALLSAIERHLLLRGDEGRWLLTMADAEQHARSEEDTDTDRLTIVLDVIEFYFVGEPLAWLRSEQLLSHLDGRHRRQPVRVGLKDSSNSASLGLIDACNIPGNDEAFAFISRYSETIRELRRLAE